MGICYEIQGSVRAMQGYHHTPSDFVVLDTEGNDTLTEVGIVGDRGEVCYHAFVKGENREPRFRLNTEPLSTIVEAIATHCRDKAVVCHHAEHDDRILRRSFERVGIPYPDFTFICTRKLARQQLPNLHSYSLSYLCKSLDVRSQGQRFSDQQAHSASYDAQFTYQLYRYLYTLQPPAMSQNPAELYKNTPNPFSSIRVNTPFEEHPDSPEIYKDEFETLKAVLHEIKGAPNNQSQGAIVLGEPGSGKTHLMMRLAQEVLKTNRLFFMPHPNNERAVNYHVYARILESFSEEIKNTKLTQLEQFFAKSFVNILSQTDWANTDKGRQIIEKLKDDNLSLYERVGTPGTSRYRKNWDIIEKHILAWWQEKSGLSTYYSSQILKGIIRFCRYTETSRKEIIRHWLAGNSDADSEELKSVDLTPWPDDLNREEFALEAIQTLGKLSLLDEPLILIFDQLESLFAERNRLTLESFGDTVKEILTRVPNSLIILNLFPDRWQRFQEIFDGSVVDRVSQTVVTLNRPSEPQLFQILKTLCQRKIETDSPYPTVDIEQLCTRDELTEIVSQPSIRAVIKRASDYFRYKVQGGSPPGNGIGTKFNPDQVEVTAAFKELKTALEELKQEFQERGKTLNIKHKGLESWEKSLETKQQKVGEKESNAVKKEQELKERERAVEAKIKAEEEEKEGLKRQIRDLKAQIEYLKSNASENTEKELIEIRGKLDEKQQELAQFKTQLYGTIRELNSTRQELIQTKSKLDDVNEELETTQHQLDYARQKWGETSRELEQTQEDLEQTQAQLDQCLNGRGNRDPELDEYWEDLLERWYKRYEMHRIISDEDDIGKLMAIVSAFSKFSNPYYLNIEQLSFGGRVIPEHLLIDTRTQTHVLAFLHCSPNAFTPRIKNLNQLLQMHPNTRFRLMRDRQVKAINTNTVGWDEIQKLMAADNGKYVVMDRYDRVIFECLYQLIIDFENRELEFDVELADIVDWMTRNLSDYWLIQCLTQ